MIKVANLMKEKLLTRDEYFSWLKKFPPQYCPFCVQQNNIVIKEGLLWDIVLNKSPYWRYHFLVIPRRHFIDFSDMSPEEFDEFQEMYKYTLKTLKKAKLTHLDGSPINKFLFFWRLRQDVFDPLMNVDKPDHFHFHIVPEVEHLWDPILDNQAISIDIGKIRALFTKSSSSN
jgi:galactose-1-phosphate uridylyltransferase